MLILYFELIKRKILLFIRIIFDENGYTIEERLQFKPVIFSNTIQSMLAILHAMGRLKIPFTDPLRQVCFFFKSNFSSTPV